MRYPALAIDQKRAGRMIPSAEVTISELSLLHYLIGEWKRRTKDSQGFIPLDFNDLYEEMWIVKPHTVSWMMRRLHRLLRAGAVEFERDGNQVWYKPNLQLEEIFVEVGEVNALL